MRLPVSVGVRVTRFALNTTYVASAHAFALAGDVIQTLTGHTADDRDAPSARRVDPRSQATEPPSAPAPPAGRSPILEASLDAEPVVEEPVHVSEEPELVAEVAEPGAEDGAGASVTVDEPWDGFAHLNAKDVIDRLAGTDPAELAAIELYEATHKRRETVMTAVARKLRRESAQARPDESH